MTKLPKLLSGDVDEVDPSLLQDSFIVAQVIGGGRFRGSPVDSVIGFVSSLFFPLPSRADGRLSLSSLVGDFVVASLVLWTVPKFT